MLLYRFLEKRQINYSVRQVAEAYYVDFSVNELKFLCSYRAHSNLDIKGAWSTLMNVYSDDILFDSEEEMVNFLERTFKLLGVDEEKDAFMEAADWELNPGEPYNASNDQEEYFPLDQSEFAPF